MRIVANTISAVVVAILVMAFGAATSRATEYYDYDNINVWLSEANRVQTGTFDIGAQGYNSSVETIISADVEFVLWDSDSNADDVTVTVDGLQIEAGRTVTQGFSIFGGSLSGQALLNLQADGRVGYRIEWLSGDSFKVSAASLIAQTAPNSVVGVPDGGMTLALLGLGLVALEWGRRKVRS
jgi:hypothetical protein